MAKDKNSFILYKDIKSSIEMLSDEEAGKVFKHLLKYVNDEQPTLEDRLLCLVWKPIETSLKRDLKKYEKRAEAARSNGKRGGRPKNPTKPNESQKTQSVILQPKKAVSVSDSDSVSVKKNIIPSKINFDGLLGLINETFGRQFRTINKNLKSKFNARISEGYTKDDIKNCILHARKDEFHKSNGFKYCTPEYFSRATTIDKYASESTLKNLNTEPTTVQKSYEELMNEEGEMN